MKLLLIFSLFATTLALPQWPYRDNQEYYGYQRNAYRSVSSEDDEVEISGRQDLKVGGQQPVSVVQETAVSQQQPVVVETGSAKPVLNAASTTDNKATAPVVQETVASTGGNKQAPAFPPATPPSPAPTDESEEDSEEEDGEEADDDNEQDEEEDEEDEEDSRRRNEPVVTKEINEDKKTVKPVEKTKTKTVEALVPGYVTDQGEVLVPFDTVVNDKKDVVAVIEDPTSYKSQPPVVVVPKPVEEPTRPVPKFFNPNANPRLYYSDVPPPGSIFTFDEDNEVEDKRGRDDTSSEEAQDDDASDESAEDEEAPKRPPLAYLKATGPSGEDDEADSLGIRPIARMGYVDSRYYDYYPDRSPNYFYNGESFYVPRYGNNYYKPVNSMYYYRPASTEKVKVVPLGSFDVSIEQREDDVRAVVGPFRYYQQGGYQQSPMRRVVRPNRRPTNVIRQRVNKARREAKELSKKINKKVVLEKKAKKVVNNKKVVKN